MILIGDPVPKRMVCQGEIRLIFLVDGFLKVYTKEIQETGLFTVNSDISWI